MKIKEKAEDFKVKEVPSFSLTPDGKHSIYRLKKRERNTENVVQELARQLDTSRDNIGYSGAKDKHAVTEQYVSILKGPKEPNLDIDKVEIEYVGRSKQPITLGSHRGNEFEIIVREYEGEPERKERVVNYFGPQRFSENNAEIGKAIVKEDYERACELTDKKEVKQHLEENPNDYLGALKQLPKKIATLYVHAYQSELWNQVAERLAADSENLEIPILGFGTKLDDGKVERAYREKMKEENISKKDFINRSWKELSMEGDTRRLYVHLEDLEIEQIEENTYKARFFLPKGSYATVAINQLFPQ